MVYYVRFTYSTGRAVRGSRSRFGLRLLCLHILHSVRLSARTVESNRNYRKQLDPTADGTEPESPTRPQVRTSVPAHRAVRWAALAPD